MTSEWTLGLLFGIGRTLGPLTYPVAGAGVQSDANDLPFLPRAMHVSVAGTIKYTAGGVTITEAWEIGWHPCAWTRFWSTGTDAAARVTFWR